MPKLSLFLVIAAVLFPFATRSLWAQGPAVMPMPAPYEAELPGLLAGQEAKGLVSLDGVEREYRSTHWKSGMIVGASLVGLFAGAGIYAFCQGSEIRQDNCGLKALMGRAMGAATGGILGALIGGLFPKQPPEDQQDYSTPNASM